MDIRTFSEAKNLVDFINSLYELMVGMDNLADVGQVTFEDKKGKDLKISTGPLGEEIHSIFRNYIKSKLKEAKDGLDKMIPSKASVVNAIEIALKVQKERGWDRTYWFFDLHGTVLKPTYSSGKICNEFYPLAKEVMQVLSDRDDVIMVMYTCSYPEEIKKYIIFFEENGIKFNYINENPEVDNSKYGFFDKKPYMNVLFEDKAGFNPETDWIATHLCLMENGLWPKITKPIEIDTVDSDLDFLEDEDKNGFGGEIYK
jgi:hypothetical protein